MLIKNTNSRYGLIAILLHWIVAILMIGLFALGLYMVELPISLSKLQYYGFHKEYGLLVLGLALLRLVWRFINKTPNLDLRWLEKFAARAVHWLFYGFMLALPITGRLITSAAGLPVSVFGWFVLPNLIAPNHDLMPVLEMIHQYLAYAFMAVLCLHVLAAFKHQWINRDGILRRMWLW